MQMLKKENFLYWKYYISICMLGVVYMNYRSKSFTASLKSIRVQVFKLTFLKLATFTCWYFVSLIKKKMTATSIKNIAEKVTSYNVV